MEEFDSKNTSKEEIEKMAAILPKRLDKLEWNDSFNKISSSSVNEFEKANEKLDKLHSEYVQAIDHERNFNQREKER